MAAPAAQAAAPAGCFDRSAPSTYEESRIDTPALPGGVQVSSALVEAGGFTSYVERLCFNAGIVEDAFGRHLTASAPRRADVIMTISQGNRGTMNIEPWAGAWRGGSPDNNNEGRAEPIPPAAGWPQPSPQPEFIETTLPYQAMISAGTTPWPVRLNPQICEWANGDRPTGPVTCTNNGPTPGSQAQSGGGGNYLSNESMYRSNRLRLALGATDVPGGHLHISAPVYPADPLVLIDQAFAADRAQTIEQTMALVKAAGAAVAGS